MKVNDLIKEYNIQTNIPETLREHKIEMIMPPADQYTYKQEGNQHIFTKTTGKVTDTITIDEKEKTISVLSEPEGMRAAYYKIDETGKTIELS